MAIAQRADKIMNTEATWKIKVCENRGNPNYIDKLSDELLIEILSRNPNCKFAIQCKCVSKRWLNLISCPFFTSQFLLHQHNSNRNNSTKPLPFALISHYLDHEEQSRTLVYSRDNPTEFGSHGFTFKFPPKNCVTEQGEQFRLWHSILGACGDLMLLSMRKVKKRGKTRLDLELDEQHNYLICNPRTKQWVWLPPFPGGNKRAAQMTLGCDPFYSFPTTHHGNASCSLNDSYRYRVISVSFDQIDLQQPKLDVFDSETRQWGKLVLCGLQHGLRYICLIPPVASNGMLHYFTCHYIVAFDLFASEMGSDIACRVIDLPVAFRQHGLAYLGSCVGRLRLSLGKLHGRSRLVRVWDLEDYYKGEWCLKHEFSLTNLKVSCNSHLIEKVNDKDAIQELRVLGFHPYDADSLYLLFPDCIAECNMRTKTLVAACEFRLKSKIRNNRIGGYMLGVLHRVLLPWWPTPVPALT